MTARDGTGLADITGTAHAGENILSIRRPHSAGSLTDKAIVVVDPRK